MNEMLHNNACHDSINHQCTFTSPVLQNIVISHTLLMFIILPLVANLCAQQPSL